MERHVHERRIVKVGPPHLHEQHLDLVPVPAQAPRQRPQGNGLQPVQEDGAPVEAHRLEDLVLGPGANGHVEHALGDVGEAGALHHVGQLAVRHGIEVDAEGGQAIRDMLPEARDGVVGRQFAVAVREGAFRRVVDFLELDPAADFEVPGR